MSILEKLSRRHSTDKVPHTLAGKPVWSDAVKFDETLAPKAKDLAAATKAGGDVVELANKPDVAQLEHDAEDQALSIAEETTEVEAHKQEALTPEPATDRTAAESVTNLPPTTPGEAA